MKRGNGFLRLAVTVALVVTAVLVTPAQARADFSQTLPGNPWPFGVAVDQRDGTIFVANQQTHTIDKIAPGGAVTQFASGFSSYGPFGVAVDGQGNVYATDPGIWSVFKYDPAGNMVWFNENDPTDGSYYVGGIMEPRGIAVGPNGVVYLANNSAYTQGLGSIRILNSADGTLNQDWYSDALNLPSGICFDAAGNMYAAESGSSTIAKMDGNGNLITRFMGAEAYAAFYQPEGIAVDAAGYIYVADTQNSRIVRVDPTGNNLTVLSSDVNHPYGVALVQGEGPSVVVGDTMNGLVKKIYPKPTATGISPASGPAAGGTEVTITGVGLANPTAVWFGGQQATITDASNPGALKVSLPAGTPGWVDVVVQGLHESSSVTASTRFDYIGRPDLGTSAVVASQTVGIVADGAATSTITVTLKDAASQVLPGHSVSLTQGSGSSAIAPAAAVTTDASGIAAFTVKNSKAETVTYTITDTTDSTVLTNSLAVEFVAGPPASISAVSGNGQSAVKNTPFTIALQATVLDKNGNPVAGATVTFSAPASGASGTFAGGSSTINVTTGANGVATATQFTANGNVGAYVVTASVTGAGTAAVYSMANTVGAPDNIAWVVNDLGDGLGSPTNVTLRYAMMQAQNDRGDTITFGVTGTIVLGSPLPVIHDYENLTITGPGAADLTISGNGQHRVFTVEGGNVSISHLTIADGKAIGQNGANGSGGDWSGQTWAGGGGGGGVGAGGGMLILDGAVSLDDVTFANCQAVGGNGGQPGQYQAYVNLGNGWGGSGGAAPNGTGGGAGGASSVGDGQSGGNGAEFAGGGGGGAGGSSGSSGTHYSGPGGNTGWGGGNGGRGGGWDFSSGVNPTGGDGGSGCGGALFAQSGSLIITNSTFTGNSVLGGNGGAGAAGGNGFGGALFVNAGTVTITGTDFAGNSVPDGSGAGVSLYNRGATVTTSGVTFDPGSSVTGQVAAPTADPIDGSMVAVDAIVTLSDATPGATIYYTIDGSAATTGSASGSASGTPVTISGNEGDIVSVNVLVTAPGKVDNRATFRYTVISNELVVTNLSDSPGSSTDVTLRYALEQARHNSGLVVTFAGSGTITLTSPLPRIINDLTIDGAGKAVTVSGGDLYRVLAVDSGTVTIKNLTIADGKAIGQPGASGADGVGQLGGNSGGGGGGGGGGAGAGIGGGLLVMGGTVSVDGVTFTHNTAIGGKGGDAGHNVGRGYGFGGPGGSGGGDTNGASGGSGGGGGHESSGGSGGNGGDFAGGGGGGGGSGGFGWGWGGVGSVGGFGGGRGGNGGMGDDIYTGPQHGAGGNGGNGLGGAVFVNAGTVTIAHSTFADNSVSAGLGGNGGGSAGSSAATAIYNRNGAVTALDSNTFGADSTTNNVLLPPAALVWLVQPGGSVQGRALTQQPALVLKDVCGNSLTGDNTSEATITLSDANGAVLGGTTTVTLISGVATFGDLTIDKAGTYTLTVTSGAVTSPLSASFTVMRPAARLTWLSQPGPMSSQLNMYWSPRVELQDADGNGEIYDHESEITLTLCDSTGVPLTNGVTMKGTLTRTVAGGIADFGTGMSTATPGVYTLKATSGSMTALSAPFPVYDFDESHLLVLGLENGRLSPAFDPAVHTYSVAVPVGAQSITLTTQPQSYNSWAIINGVWCDTWSDTNSIPLNQSGQTQISIELSDWFFPIDSYTLTVNPTSATRLAIAASQTQAAGAPFDVTVTALDAQGNIATDYRGTVRLSTDDGNSPSGQVPTLPIDYTFTAADAGEHTFSVTLNNAKAAAAVTVNELSLGLAAQSTSVAVKGGTAVELTVSAGASQTAGVPFDITVSALDAFGNPTSAYTGTIAVTTDDGASPSGRAPALPANHTFVAGDAGRHTFGVTLFNQTASATITVTDQSSGLAPATADVAVASANASRFLVAAGAVSEAGAPFAVAIKALDAFGNTVTGHTGTVRLATDDGSSPSGQAPLLPAEHTFSAGDAGEHTLSLTLYNARPTASITATDVSQPSISGSVATSIKGGAATQLALNVGAAQTAGVPFGVTVSALDVYGNVAPGYTGSVRLTTDSGSSPGGQAPLLPADYTYTAGDAGKHVFGMTLFSIAPTATITATDLAASASVGTAAVAVRAPSSEAPTLAINTASLSDGMVGQRYSQPITTNGQGTPPYSFSVASGTLPPGLTLGASSGAVSGTPTQAGVFAFVISVKDARGSTAGSALNLTVEPATRTVVVTPAAGGTVSLGTEASLSIPAGALSGSAAASVTVFKAPSPPPAPRGYSIAGAFEFSVNGQEHYSFGRPVTLTFSFDPARVARGKSPAVYYHDGARWILVTSVVDWTNHTITTTIDHFTQFAVMAQEAAALTDVSGTWAEGAIRKLADAGAITGYPDGTFRPDANITRAEFVTVLVKALALEPKAGPAFADTAGTWAESYIATASAHGIVTGYDANRFAPDAFITREEMAVMVARAANLVPLTGSLPFGDSAEIKGWASGYVLAAVNGDVLHGYPDGTFRPRNRATRAEAVTLIAGLVK